MCIRDRCHSEQQPIQISTPFVPDLVSISLGKGEYICGCSATVDISNAKEDDTIEVRAEIPLIHIIITVVVVVGIMLILLLVGGSIAT